MTRASLLLATLLLAPLAVDRPRPLPAGSASLAAQVVPPARNPTEVLLFGGGTGHDFAPWFGGQDALTLRGLGRLRYTESAAVVQASLETLGVLVFSTNQPLADPTFRDALEAFVARGGGLVVLHAGTWFNRLDWFEWTHELLAGGTHSHETYGGFEVRRDPAAHPLLAGVPGAFLVVDELYRIELDPDPGTTVLATGHSATSGDDFPVLWTRAYGRGDVVGLSLGHDGGAHLDANYARLLRNAVRWVAR